MTITIFGKGNFGELIAKLCPKGTEVNLLSLRPLSDYGLEQVLAKTDILFLAIPFSAYDLSLDRIKDFLRPETLLVDVCSVKVLPQKKIVEILPDHKNVLISHPLFGPQSTKNGTMTEGLSLVICNKSGELADDVVSFCANQLKLKIVNMSAEEHDREMANVHALTFFVSEALGKLKLKYRNLKTPSFIELLDVARLAELETEDLLNLIQNDNPFSKEVRDNFIAKINEVNAKYYRDISKI